MDPCHPKAKLLRNERSLGSDEDEEGSEHEAELAEAEGKDAGWSNEGEEDLESELNEGEEKLDEDEPAEAVGEDLEDISDDEYQEPLQQNARTETGWTEALADLRNLTGQKRLLIMTRSPTRFQTPIDSDAIAMGDKITTLGQNNGVQKSVNVRVL